MTNIRNYQDALALWASIKPLRGSPDHRPLGTRSSRNPRSVRQDVAGAIRFRLYDTDVIVWHPDGTLEVNGWASMTTSKFLNSHSMRPDLYLTGDTLCVRGADNLWSYVRCDRGDKVLLRADTIGLTIVNRDTLRPWTWRVPDRKRTRELLQATDYARLRAGVRMALAMSGGTRRILDPGPAHNSDLVKAAEILLRGEGPAVTLEAIHWLQPVYPLRGGGCVRYIPNDEVLSQLRAAMYRLRPEVFDTFSEPVLGYGKLKAVEAAVKTWGEP